MARSVVMLLVAAALGACSSTVEPLPAGTGGQSCPVGAAGCPCTGQGACDPGLECEPMLDTCIVPEECNVGAPGCECTEADSCDEGFICMEEVCVSDMPCNLEDIGTEGCQCTMGGSCDPGLECLSETCVSVTEETTSTTTQTETGTGSSTSTVDGSSGG